MNGQIFHRNNARIVRAQTVVKAFEQGIGSCKGAPLFLSDHGTARVYRAVGVMGETNTSYKVKMVKGRRRIVFR